MTAAITCCRSSFFFLAFFLFAPLFLFFVLFLSVKQQLSFPCCFAGATTTAAVVSSVSFCPWNRFLFLFGTYVVLLAAFPFQSSCITFFRTSVVCFALFRFIFLCAFRFYYFSLFLLFSFCYGLGCFVLFLYPARYHFTCHVPYLDGLFGLLCYTVCGLIICTSLLMG